MSKFRSFVLALSIGLLSISGFLVLSINALIFIDYLWLIIPFMLILLIVLCMVTKHFYLRFRA